jgi:hypothetical protein
MGNRSYAVAFLIVLLAAGAGAFFGGRFILRTVEGQALSGSSWAPPDQRTETPAAAALATDDGAGAVVQPAAQATAARPGDSTPDLSRVTVVPFAPPTPTEFPTPEVALVDTPFPAATEPPLVLPTLAPTLAPTEYVPVGQVRYSTGDCPGTYILGRVIGPNGNPLPDVRLLLVDEYGNAQAKLTKAGANEAGQYDFPLFGAHRRFYLSIADTGGNPLSPVVEIDYGVGANPGATCHRLDWRKQ